MDCPVNKKHKTKEIVLFTTKEFFCEECQNSVHKLKSNDVFIKKDYLEKARFVRGNYNFYNSEEFLKWTPNDQQEFWDIKSTLDYMDTHWQV